MGISYHEQSHCFHLFNDQISYIFCIMQDGQLGHLYFGKQIEDQADFSHLMVQRACVLAPCVFPNNLNFSHEVLSREYPDYGTGDYRQPALQIRNACGDRATHFVYKSHHISEGKTAFASLPSTFACEKEAQTLVITLFDERLHLTLQLHYTIFNAYAIIARSACLISQSDHPVSLERAVSACLDLPDCAFEMLTLDGAWSRERHLHTRKLAHGIQSVSSTRGASSATHNPFIALKRPHTTEHQGEVYGFQLLYSGNFMSSVEVDCYDVSRVLQGINPFEFEWKLSKNESFQTPESLLCYADEGLNQMSQTYHAFYHQHLIRSAWKERPRPILVNNWEATYFDFSHEKLIHIAKKAKEVGIELFVLDDGWFGKRDNDKTSLGDWFVYQQKLPKGLLALSDEIHDMGLLFGLWFEPEMVNRSSELYEQHPEWVVGIPECAPIYGRNQMVLDFANPQVVDAIFAMMDAMITNHRIDYIKWDMNRNITHAYSPTLPQDQQKEFFHRYILGVYALYERLLQAHPHLLMEGCASGGARFDAGMLYYAPQSWVSDDTDAAERLRIQMGTSLAYPLSAMGNHITAVPNHQVHRMTSLQMRSDVAMFGVFGYELDLCALSAEALQTIAQQIAFYQQYRMILQYGQFYRLQTGENGYYSWIVVAKDQNTAIFAHYKILATPNPSHKRIRLVGLDAKKRYHCEQRNCTYAGDELMHVGFLCDAEFTGLIQSKDFDGIYDSGTDKGDFTSHLYTLCYCP